MNKRGDQNPLEKRIRSAGFFAEAFTEKPDE